MSDQGCTPVEVPSLLEFRDYDLVVRCLELVRQHIPEFAPQCRSWGVRTIALCHHCPDSIYPAFGVYEAGGAEYQEIECFGQKADEWVRKQAFGWLLDASAKIDATSWNQLFNSLSRPSPARS